MDPNSILGPKEEIKAILKALGLENGKVKQPKNELVYALSNGIYLHQQEKEDLLVLAGPAQGIKSLCTHNNMLFYGAGNNCIYEALSNEAIGKRDGAVFALCSHEDELYDGGYYNETFETFTNKSVLSLHWTYALCSHNRELYSANGLISSISLTLKQEPFVARTESVLALCSHNGKMYEGRGKAIYESESNVKIAERPDLVETLCSHNGTLYDAGDYEGIYETLTGKELSKTPAGIIALCPVPPEIVKKILEKNKRLTSFS